MEYVILYPSTTTYCSISFHPSVPLNCSHSRYSSKRVNKLLRDTHKPLMVVIVIHSEQSGVFIYPFLCWNKTVGDNLGGEHRANKAAWCPSLPLFLLSFPSSICSPSLSPNPISPIHQLQVISSGHGGGGVSGW